MIGAFENQVETVLAESVSVFQFTKASIAKLRTDYYILGI